MVSGFISETSIVLTGLDGSVVREVITGTDFLEQAIVMITHKNKPVNVFFTGNKIS